MSKRGGKSPTAKRTLTREGPTNLQAKVFLCTDDANSSKWISQTIGEVEIERLRESRMEGYFPRNRRDSRSYQLERTTERLVMASEILGLPDLRAYLRSGNPVVPPSFPYIGLPKRYEALIERRLPALGPKEGSAQTLRMPVIGANLVRLSEPAIKEQCSPIGYLEALLAVEAEERDRHAVQKRIRDAKLLRRQRNDYCSFAYSAFASFRMGMSGSASFQSVRKSL